MKKSEFKDRLREALNYRNLKPVDLADKLCVSRSTISQYCSGSIKPKRDRVFEISKILDVSPVWLLGYNVPIEQSYDYIADNFIIDVQEKPASHLYLSQYLRLINKNLNEADTQELSNAIDAFVSAWVSQKEKQKGANDENRKV